VQSENPADTACGGFSANFVEFSAANAKAGKVDF